MFNESLMNPEFLKKELADSIELLAEYEEFVQVLETDFDRIHGYIPTIKRSGDTITMTKEQWTDIIQVLTKVEVNRYRMTSSYRVTISQYKQILKDRRYRIATRIARIFKK